MRISVQTPTKDGLGSVVRALASWQQEGMPVQVAPRRPRLAVAIRARRVADSLGVS